jgi:hypothetical protein
MIARHARIVTGNAVRLFMTGQTVVAYRSCAVHDRLDRPAMILEPVSLVRFRPGKGNLCGAGRAGISRLCQREYEERDSSGGQQEEIPYNESTMHP